MVPAAEQRRDHSSQKPHCRVLVELLGKIKSRRNPEALEGGAQRGKIHIGISNYDPDLTKFAARAHSSQDTPRDLLRLAVDGRCGKRLYSGFGALTLQAPLFESHAEQRLPRGIRTIHRRQRDGQLRVSAEGADHSQLRIGEREEPVYPDGSHTRQALLRDAARRSLEPAGAQSRASARQFALHLFVYGHKGLAE